MRRSSLPSRGLHLSGRASRLDCGYSRRSSDVNLRYAASHAANTGDQCYPFGYADCAPGIQNVEKVRAFEAQLVSLAQREAAARFGVFEIRVGVEQTERFRLVRVKQRTTSFCRCNFKIIDRKLELFFKP